MDSNNIDVDEMMKAIDEISKKLSEMFQDILNPKEPAETPEPEPRRLLVTDLREEGFWVEKALHGYIVVHPGGLVRTQWSKANSDPIIFNGEKYLWPDIGYEEPHKSENNDRLEQFLFKLEDLISDTWQESLDD